MKTYYANLATREEGMEENRFRAVITNGTVDRYGTAFDPNGGKIEAYMKNPVVFLKHDRSELPIGRATKLELKNGQWEAEFVIDGFTELERIVIQKLNSGTLNAVSIGAVINPDKVEKLGNGDIIFREWELHEFSVVDVPGNPEALVTARDFSQMVASHKEFRMQHEAFRELVEREMMPLQRSLDDIKEVLNHLQMAVEVLTELVEEATLEEGSESEEEVSDEEAQDVERLVEALIEWRMKNAN